MGTIAKLTAGGTTHLLASTCYATCETAAGTAAKVATIQDSQAFTLINGVTVHVKFTYSNSATNPTLNVNGTGAKNVYIYGTTAPSAFSAASWNAGAVVSFTYDGSSWQMNNWNPGSVYYVAGPSTDTTAGTWTGTISGVTAYYDGLTVIYVPAVAGASTTTLNINSLGAITCYYTNTTKLTTHFSVGTPIMLTYYGGYWRRADYDSNSTTISNLYHQYGNWVANSAVYRYQLLFEADENTLTPLNNVDNGNGSTSKTMLTSVEFNPFGKIYYYNSTTSVTANGAIGAGALLYGVNLIDGRFTFNHGTTLTAHKPFYLKVSLQSNGKCKIASASPWSNTLPTSNDGYLYILIGRTYDTYRLCLYPDHPVYYHDGTAVRRKDASTVVNSAPTLAWNTTSTIGTVNGTALTVKLPANPNTNTTYSAGTGLSLSSTTFNHSNSVSAGTAGTASATSGSTLAVPYVTYDAQGHITASGTHTHTISGFSSSSHTHTTSIATSSGTNQITLAASTKYAITAGGTSYIFTTPPNTTYSAITNTEIDNLFT